MRQGFLTEYDPRRGVSIATLAYEYPRGLEVPPHSHGSDQLIYATRGVMEVSAVQSLWWIPPQFGLWIPARTTHSIHMPGPVSMRTLYLRRGLAPRLAAGCRVLHVPPLLRELIVEAVRVGELQARNRRHRALRELILWQLQTASPVPTFVALPGDPRALHVARALLANAADRRPLRALCARSGASVRTMERIFQREVGTDFESWRRHVRLMKAVEVLVAGSPVKAAAAAAGYLQPSAFVATFRRSFGATPKAWTAALEKPAPNPLYSARQST